MKRLDKIATENSEDLFTKAFYEELLTPTAVAETFGDGPEDRLSALFARLSPELIDPAALSPDSQRLYEELMDKVRTADFMNALVGGDPDSLEEQVATEAGMNIAMGNVARAVTANLVTLQKEAKEASKALADWYNTLDRSSIENLGINPDLIASPTASDYNESSKIHETNKLVLDQQISDLFTVDVDNPQKRLPSDFLAPNYDADADYLLKLFDAYANDHYIQNDADNADFLSKLQEGRGYVESWRNKLDDITASVDYYTHAFTSGILVNPTGEANFNLPSADGGTINALNVLKYIVPDSLIYDPASGDLITGEAYAENYLGNMPGKFALSDTTASFARWMKTNLKIDIEPFLNAHLSNVEQFNNGVTLGTVQPRILDTDKILGQIKANLESEDGAARGLAAADWATYVEMRIAAVDPQQPQTGFPWQDDKQLEQIRLEVEKQVLPTAGELGGEVGQIWMDLNERRQEFVANYIVATDEARPLYEMQIAITNNRLKAIETEIIKVLTEGVSGNPSLQDNIFIITQVFDDTRAAAESLRDQAADYADVFGGTRTDVPLSQAKLATNPDSMIDLRWDPSTDNLELLLQTNKAYDNKAYSIGSDAWRSATSDDYFKQLLPYLVSESDAGIDVSQYQTIADLEAALTGPGQPSEFIGQARQIADRLVAYNQSLIAYEADLTTFLLTDPFDRSVSWSEDPNLTGLAEANRTDYDALKTALANANLDTSFLRSEAVIPGLGGADDSTFSYVEARGTVFAILDRGAATHDRQAFNGLSKVHDLIGIDAVMTGAWRGDAYRNVQLKLDTGLKSVNLPGGEKPQGGAWIDGLAKTILQYNTAVLAYEEALTRGLLEGKSPADILNDAAPQKLAIDFLRDAALSRIENSGAFGNNPPPAEEILKTLYGDLLTGDAIENTSTGAGPSVKDKILNTGYVAYKTGDANASTIHYFDPVDGQMKEISGNLADYSSASKPSVPANVIDSTIDITDDSLRNLNDSLQTAFMAEGFKAIHDLRSQKAPDIDAIDQAVIGEKTGGFGKALTASDAGFAIVGAGQLVADLAQGADPITVAAGVGYTLQELSDTIAEFVEEAFSSKTTTPIGKYAALKAFASVAGAVGAVSSIGINLEKRDILIAEGKSTAGLDAQIALEMTGTALMTLDAVMSSLVFAGKITGMAAKAAPLIGATAQILLAVQPGRKAFYDIRQDAIADTAARGDFSSELAASLMQKDFDNDKVEDAAQYWIGLGSAGVGLISAAIAFGTATGGVGAAAVAAAATIASVVVSIISAEKARKLAEDARKQILEEPGVDSYQDYFDLSFEQQKQELQELYTEVAEELTTSGGFGTFVGLSTQRMTQDDLYVARTGDIGDSITKSAATYVSEYRDGEWEKTGATTTTLVPGPGPDIIDVTDDDDPVYVTILNALQASSAPTRLKIYQDLLYDISGTFDKNRVTTETFEVNDYVDIDGWRAVDADGNRTTFDVSQVVSLVNYNDWTKQREVTQKIEDKTGKDIFGPNELGTHAGNFFPNERQQKLLPFVIEAGDNDDTAFLHDGLVAFDGGTGTDTASYARLNTDVLDHKSGEFLLGGLYGGDGVGDGIVIRSRADRLTDAEYTVQDNAGWTARLSNALGAEADANAIIVEKPIHFDHGLLYQAISYEFISGEALEKHDLGRTLGSTIAYDQLRNIEVLQGSAASDYIDLRGYAAAGSNRVAELYGFDGDDVLIADEVTVTIGGGFGDDFIEISSPWQKLKAAFETFAAAEAELSTWSLTAASRTADREAAEEAFQSADEARLALEEALAQASSAQEVAQLTEQLAEAQATYDSALYDYNVSQSLENSALRIKDQRQVPYDEALAALQAVEIFVNGGEGHDTVSFDAASFNDLLAAYRTYLDDRAETELIFAAIGDATESNFGGSAVLDLFRKGFADYTGTAADHIDLQDVEGIGVSLELPQLPSTAASGEFAQLPYLTPALNGVSTGDPAYDAVFYAADYQKVFDDLFGQSHTFGINGLGFDEFTIHNLNSSWDQGILDLKFVSLYSAGEDLSALTSFGESVTRNYDPANEATLEHAGPDPSLNVLKGKVYLVAGTSYAFSPALEAALPAGQQTTDLFALTREGSVSVLNLDAFRGNDGVAAEVTITETGYYDFVWATRGSEGAKSKLTYTSAPDSETLATKVANGEGFVPVAMESLTGGFAESLPYATRNTFEVTTQNASLWNSYTDTGTFTPQAYANDPAAVSAPQALYGDLTGELAKGILKRIEGEIWLEAGETYTFMVAADDVDVHLSVAGNVLLHDTSPSGRYENTEVTVTATQTGFQQFVFVAAARNDDGRFGLYTRPSDAANGQYWAVLGNTEGRAADLSGADLTAQDVDDMGGGVTLIGNDRGEKLTGSLGNDLIYGGDGHDIFDGGDGNDIYIGGAGADRIRLGLTSGTDLLVEERSSDWDFTTINYDGVIQAESNIEGWNMLLAWQTVTGDIAIGSLALYELVPGGGADWPQQIKASLVLSADDYSDIGKVRIIDSKGEGISAYDLLARTNAYRIGTRTVEKEYGVHVASQAYQELVPVMGRAISDWNNDWAALSAGERYQTALNGIGDTEEATSAALQEFMRENGIVLKSQAIFNLEEALQAGQLAPDVAAKFLSDDEGDVLLQKDDGAVSIFSLDDKPIALPTTSDLTFAGFVKFGDLKSGFENLVTLSFGNAGAIGIDYGVGFGGRLGFQVERVGGSPPELQEPASNGNAHLISTADYTHIALRIEGDTLKLFVDGAEFVLEGDAASLIALAASGNPLTGMSFGAASGNREVHFDNVYVFDEALSDAQIAALAAEQPALVNNAPFAYSDAFTTDEETAISGDLFDANPNSADTDPEGDLISVVAVNGEDAFLNGPIHLPSGALLTVRADGTFDYDPNGAFNHLMANENASDSFTYTVSDGLDGTATATVFIGINGVNDQPYALNENFDTDENTPLVLDVSTLMANDGDPDANDTLRIVGVETDLTTGDAYMLDDNTIVYDPTVAFQHLRKGAGAVDSVKYILEDSSGAQTKATIYVDVWGRNDAPETQADHFSTDVGSPLQIDIAALLANDSDPDIWGSVSFVGLDDSQTMGSVDFGGGSSFTYEATGPMSGLSAGATATDTILYTVRDQHGAQSTGQVLVEVTGINHPVTVSLEDVEGEVTKGDSSGLLTDSGEIKFFDGNLSDPHLVSYGLVSSTLPESVGQFSVDLSDAQPGDGNKTVTWTYSAWNSALALLAPGQNATEVYEISIRDPFGSVVTREVTVTINGEAIPVAAFDDAFEVSGQATAILDVLANDTGPDGTPLTLVGLTSQPASGLVSIVDNKIVFDPNGEFLSPTEEVVEFSYQMTDGAGTIADATVTVTVEAFDGPLITTETKHYPDGRIRETTFVDGVRSKVVMTDPEDAHGWSNYIDTYDAAGERVGRTMTYDDGREVETTFVAGTRSERIMKDLGDVFTWKTVEQDFDADGQYSREFKTYDDGREELTTFLAGTRSERTIEDLGDAFNWTSIEQNFDADGQRSSELKIYDDGRKDLTTFLSGTRSERHVEDLGDAFDWTTIEQDFDANGKHESQLIMYDDGRIQHTSYFDGVRGSVVSLDAGNAHDWFRNLQSFDAEGKPAEQFIAYDDGRQVHTTFVSGVRSERILQDTGDVFTWKTIEQDFDANGQRVSELTIYDDGRSLDMTYVDGIRSELVAQDEDDAYDWTSYVDTYDASGQRVDRTMTYDDGREVVTVFTDDSLLV